MSRRFARVLLIAAVLAGASASAAECPAAKAMAEGVKALEQRKDNLQRREWLLLEYLSSDGSKKSRKLFEQEVANSKQRTENMMAHLESLKALPPDTPDIPDEGTLACQTITQVKTAIDELMDTREKELLDLTGKTYPFLKACDEIGVKLVNLAASTRDPEVTPQSVAMLKTTVDIVMGPQIYQSRMDHRDFGRLVNEVFSASGLNPRTVAAYGGLRCLRGYQRASIKSLPDAAAKLAECPPSPWAELGHCLGTVTRP
jgi:hypothetical protein